MVVQAEHWINNLQLSEIATLTVGYQLASIKLGDISVSKHRKARQQHVIYEKTTFVRGVSCAVSFNITNL